ncbi:MAG: exodeoxyribonuclease V subunit beta [Lentisphaeria bacterium]
MNDLSEYIKNSESRLLGRHLISASAGTGKTYSIQSLYLLLILQNKLTVQQILVVTFTKAATKELKERLHAIIQEAYDSVSEKIPSEEITPRIYDILSRFPKSEKKSNENLLRNALLDFDLASIFTIHGFCSRVLSRFAFETGQSFDLKPAEGSMKEVEQLCQDWWRTHIYSMDFEKLQLYQSSGLNYDILLELTKNKIEKPDSKFKNSAPYTENIFKKINEIIRGLCTSFGHPIEMEQYESLRPQSKNKVDALDQKMSALVAEIETQIAPLSFSQIQNFISIEQYDFSYTAKKVEYNALDEFAPEWKSAIQMVKNLLSNYLTSGATSIAEKYQTLVYQRDTSNFSDYLNNLKKALLNKKEGPALRKMLRNEFKAALIDEFQDTDPVQWGIFSSIFDNISTDSAPCFLVGDPKQAIYRFRNGDIVTYMKATGTIQQTNKHQLNKNYRSEENLIFAFNEFFKDQKDPTFQHPEMEYPGDLKANGKKLEDSLTVNGQIDPRPFKVFYIDVPKPTKITPGQDSPIMQFAFQKTAAEIVAILNDKQICIAGKPVRPAQIAVLVNKHKEANAIAAELRKREVPVVQQATGNIWETTDASDFRQFLDAVLHPENSSILRAALLLPYIYYSPDQLLLLNENQAVLPDWCAPEEKQNSTLVEWVQFFMELREIWIKHGFFAMFVKWMKELHLRCRWSADSNGRRSLTNLLHLAELIQQELLQTDHSPELLFSWFSQQINTGKQNVSDNTKLHVESDEDAVQIMTIFRSKGLEFPIVFVPTLINKNIEVTKTQIYEAHNAEGELEISLQKLKNTAQEEFEECIRLTYVAVTRAEHRVVLFWANYNTEPNKNPLAWLFRAVNFNNTDPDPYQYIELKKFLVSNEIKVDCLTKTPENPELLRKMPLLLPKIEHSSDYGSFTSLIQLGSVLDTGKDYDEKTDDVPELEEDPASIFTFPAGAKTGTCWHEILEDLDFTASDSDIQEIVHEKLESYGFLKKEEFASVYEDTVLNMVKKTLNISLPSFQNSTPFSLKELALCDRKTEWEFNFSSLKRDVYTTKIKKILSCYPEYQSFIQDLNTWDCKLPQGYLMGFVDLLFRYHDRYYIVDWKSNSRNRRLSDFNRAGLHAEMSQHRYWFQYLLYAVAVHQYLKHALPNYDYEHDFGGVYYIFLRGTEEPETHGVYADRPKLQVLEELSALLGEFE